MEAGASVFRRRAAASEGPRLYGDCGGLRLQPVAAGDAEGIRLQGNGFDSAGEDEQQYRMDDFPEEK